MPNRASLRQPSGPLSPRASGNIALAGNRTPSRVSSDVVDARSDILRCTSELVNPAVPRGTRKPRMPSSVRAHTVATSAMLPLVIHILLPVRIQSEPSRTARVRMPAGLEPKSGSVSPKQPIASPPASRGSHSSFCSSEPYFQIENIDSDPCTETKLRNPLSPASSSIQARP